VGYADFNFFGSGSSGLGMSRYSLRGFWRFIPKMDLLEISNLEQEISGSIQSH